MHVINRENRRKKSLQQLQVLVHHDGRRTWDLLPPPQEGQLIGREEGHPSPQAARLF